MYSKIMILIWERWQRTRWAVLAACLLPLSGQILYVLGHTTLNHAAAVTGILFFLCFILLTGYLLVGQCEARHLEIAFQERLFRLPVRTTTLLAVYMGYGIVAVALPSLMLFGFELLFLDSVIFKWKTLLIIETVYISLQTLSWLGGPARFLCVVLSFTGAYALFKLADRFDLPMGADILYPTIIILCGAISFWSVSEHRRGAWLNTWQWVDYFLGMFRKSHLKPFPSALHAQIWFELRQTGHLFPLSTLCIISPFLGFAVYWLVTGLPPSESVSFLVSSMLLATLVAAWLAGMLSFAIHHRNNVSGASSFFLRCPIATWRLAGARLCAMALSLARALAILTVIALVLVARDWATGALDDAVLSDLSASGENPIEVVITTVLVLYILVLFYWTLLMLSLPITVCLIAAGLIFLLTWGTSSTWAGNTMIVIPVGVLIASYIAKRCNLITTSTLVIAACVFPLVVVSLWVSPWWHGPGTINGLFSLNLWQIIRLISAATLPFIPLVASPLLMERLRHR